MTDYELQFTDRIKGLRDNFLYEGIFTGTYQFDYEDEEITIYATPNWDEEDMISIQINEIDSDNIILEKRIKWKFTHDIGLDTFNFLSIIDDIFKDYFPNKK